MYDNSVVLKLWLMYIEYVQKRIILLRVMLSALVVSVWLWYTRDTLTTYD